MTTKNAFKLAGLSAVVAGLLFALIQFIHPEDSFSSLTTSQWLTAHIFTFIFPIFGLFGLTGIYAKQVKQSGYLGLVGYVGLSIAFVFLICFGFYEAFISPVLATEAPAYAVSALSILDGEPGPKYLGMVYQLNGAFYLLGGLIFAISTLKAKVFPKWASGLLLIGLMATLSAAAIPAMARPSAVLFGLGMAALGYSLLSKAGGRA